MKKLTIKDWKLDERPREKLMDYGPEKLSDAELLAVIIGTGHRGGTAIDMARLLLSDYGTVRSLLKASAVDLSCRKGMGAAKVGRLLAAVELGRRYLADAPKRGDSLTEPDKVRDYLLQRLRDRDYEVFCILYLDNRNRVISFEEMFQGTIDSTQVHLREVVKRALDQAAAALIAVHNHPSGDSEPSKADHMITKRLAKALELMEIRLLDHFVVGDGNITSFAERGWL